MTMAKGAQDVSAAAYTLRQQLLADGILKSPDAEMIPLTGGVSSDVYLVRDLERCFVVKQALASLKVRDSWQADVARNISERDYLSYVGKRLPKTVPALIDSRDDYFVMEYLGDGFANWKNLLLAGQCDPMHAALAGNTLGTIHRISSHNREAESLFDTGKLFHQLRIDPYLLATGRRHPELQKYFADEAERLESTRECLVHGDYSPKNILIRGNHLVVLDCETAWYGDPAFDLAFLLCHLLLKGLFHAPRQVGASEIAGGAANAYFRAFGISEKKQRQIEERTAKLVLMLILARVDGKSPADYLTESHKQFIRHFVTKRLECPPSRLRTMTDLWFSDSLAYRQAAESK